MWPNRSYRSCANGSAAPARLRAFVPQRRRRRGLVAAFAEHELRSGLQAAVAEAMVSAGSADTSS